MVGSFILSLLIILGAVRFFVRAVKALRALRRPGVSLAFGLAAPAALAVGFWLGIAHEYRTGDSFRLQGAPVPLVVFHLEGEDWVDFVKPLGLTYVCAAANVLFSLWVLSFLCSIVCGRLIKRQSAGPESGRDPVV